MSNAKKPPARTAGSGKKPRGRAGARSDVRSSRARTGMEKTAESARSGSGKGQGGANKTTVKARSTKAREQRWRTLFRRAFRWAWRLAVVALMIPIVLVPLYTVVSPVSTLMIWQSLREGTVDRRWVSLEEIAPSLVNSVLMSEDGKFCSHSGVDWDELNRVLTDENGPSRGASTISMQTVKNVFLWQSRSVVRKGLEIPLAIFADTIWGKRRMMEIYLNIVEWGPGVFGAEAAAQHHFGRSASRLNASQSALLAVTLPNPGLRDPAHPSSRLSALASTVAKRARASGAYIDCLL